MIKPGRVIPAKTPNKWIFTIINEHGRECSVKSIEWVSVWLCKQAMRDYVLKHNTILKN